MSKMLLLYYLHGFWASYDGGLDILPATQLPVKINYGINQQSQDTYPLNKAE